MGYVLDVIDEMEKRNIKYKEKYYEEINKFCDGYNALIYPEHNERYLTQCYYNLQEKYDRGIITKEEWLKIEEETNERIII